MLTVAASRPSLHTGELHSKSSTAGGNSGHYISVRALRHFMAVHCPEYCAPSLVAVFKGLLASRFCASGQGIYHSLTQCVHATLDLYNVVRNYLLPTPSHCHYVFAIGAAFAMVQVSARRPTRESIP